MAKLSGVSGRRVDRPHVMAWACVAAFALACTEPEAPPEAAPASAATPLRAVPFAPQLTVRMPGPVAPAGPLAPVAPAPQMAIRAAPETPPPPGPRYVDARIERSLEGALVKVAGRDVGPSLTQVVKRVLVWWMDVRKDFRPGDRVELVYEVPDDGSEPIAHALWLTSERLGGQRSAVRFQAAGDRFARWYEPSGLEVERRLVNGPIDDYEQVTSLLNDGRRHRGVDFKAPVGTPIKSPFNGVVTRRNWSTRRNGNCLSLRDSKTGLTALLLHLDSIPASIKPGRRVKIGDVVAMSGNTGRSTAPHLHYQLQRGRKVKNPFRVHTTRQRQLSPEDLEAARAAMARFAEMRAGSM